MAKNRTSKGQAVVIYLELPDEKVELKAVLERIARRHNRKLTGECIQALEEYAQAHDTAPEDDSKVERKELRKTK